MALRVSHCPRHLRRLSLRSLSLPRVAPFSSTSYPLDYANTISHLNIGSHTRVIYQGFTGKQATVNALQSIDYGTKVVGGVTPGREGEHLDLPVLASVKAAKDALNPGATAIFVAAQYAAGAIEEAVEAEIPLIVAVAEHVPVHDMLRVHSMLSTQSKCRLIGANSPGIISAIHRCRIGFQPIPCFSPGHVGIVSKSGTLSYETAASTTRAGLGQSLCIGMGGDVVAGTDFVDALRVFENDEDTQGIILIGEVGGRAEEDAAEWIREYRKRCTSPKPIAALVVGMCARPGYIMGHAGAFASPGEASADEKYYALQDAGVTMVDHPSKFGNVMKRLLHGSTGGSAPSTTASQQRRGLHTLLRQRPSPTPSVLQHRRALHISSSQAHTFLSTFLHEQHSIPYLITTPPDSEAAALLGITIDRTTRAPCLVSARLDPSSTSAPDRKLFPFCYTHGPGVAIIGAALTHAHLISHTGAAQHAAELLGFLWQAFRAAEALRLEVQVAIVDEGGANEGTGPSIGSSGSHHGHGTGHGAGHGTGHGNGHDHGSTETIVAFAPECSFDDAGTAAAAALRPQPAPDATDADADAAATAAAARDGIAFVRLLGPPSDSPTAAAAVGTIVNGAGLAMNTVDALGARGASAGIRAANFLDTGGKATAATVARCFELVLAEPRVAAVLVNIFGGLTKGDVVAEGVVMAFKDARGKGARGEVPVVVRIRGTNEEEGRKIIAESGYPLYAFDDFDAAAEKAIELAKGRLQ
ncbi:succinyl-CoA synthetase-like protein [Lineolata rhizophorae]|uniref:Succinyl-CoA synthetase-like protein n=1 Tax=Lineolata rhizophorae TaxID=578093 RepID=A0A6A6P5L8_9PEZI|nr:succinyl-CoA synthetase-like protein [Lineolata rhizophorae]